MLDTLQLETQDTLTVGNAIVILAQSVRKTLFRGQETMQANTYEYAYCTFVPMRYLMHIWVCKSLRNMINIKGQR